MPTFLFESMGNIIMYLLIMLVIKKVVQLKRGDMVYLYCIGYSTVRFFVEGLRTDSLMFGSIRMAQLTSLALIGLGIFGLLGGFRKIFKPNKPIILWDLDGTILDTEPAIIETYRQLFVKYSDESSFDEEKKLEVLGPALKTMFPIYFPGKDADALIQEYRELNYELHKTHVFMMNHVKETLQSLKNQGYRMGIVSTKSTEGVNYGLSLFELDSYFEVIIGEELVSKGKPNPEGILKACQEMGASHDDVIYIGDSITDVEAAKNAGVFSIGYIFNQNRKDSLIESKPNRVIEDLYEVTEIVKEDHGWTYNMM
ncbi:MAG: HAD-IA family hydrolase, partial [Erysipelotrichaceae bacterium]